MDVTNKRKEETEKGGNGPNEKPDWWFSSRQSHSTHTHRVFSLLPVNKKIKETKNTGLGLAPIFGFFFSILGSSVDVYIIPGHVLHTGARSANKQSILVIYQHSSALVAAAGGKCTD